MFHSNVPRFILAFHVALIPLFALMAIVWPMFSHALPFFFLAWMVALFAFCLPSPRTGENLMEARERMLFSVVWDPFSYIGALGLLFLWIGALNGDCRLIFQPDTGYWVMGDPPMGWLPFSVKRLHALPWVGVFFAGFLGVLAIRNALTRTPKRFLLEFLATASGLFALILSLCFLSPTPAQSAFLQTAKAEGLGGLFGFWALVGLGLFVELANGENRTWANRRLFLLGVYANLLGAIFFAEAISGIVVLVLFVVVSLVGMMTFRGGHRGGGALKLFMIVVLLAAATYVPLRYFCEGNPVAKKVEQIQDWESYSKRFTEILPARVVAATDLFKEHLWFGVGRGGFEHFVGLTLKSDSEWTPFKHDRASVKSDYLQLLVENGLVGTAFLLLSFVVLAVPVISRMRIRGSLRKHGRADEDDSFSVLGFSVFAAMLFLALAAGVGSPFAVSPVLISFFFVLASLPVFLPVRRGFSAAPRADQKVDVEKESRA